MIFENSLVHVFFSKLHSKPSQFKPSQVKNFQLPERQETFLQRHIKKLSIRITSLAKYFAGAERNDEVEKSLNAST